MRNLGHDRDVEASLWIARLDRVPTDESIDDLLARTALDSRNEVRSLELSRIRDQMDVLAQLRELLPFPSLHREW